MSLLSRIAPRRPAHPRLLALIALAYLAWGFCYPPFPLGTLAFLVLVPVFAATSRLKVHQAFWYNFAGGILYNTVMYWWIYNVVKVGPALVIGAGLVVLILFLSLFNGILGWLFRVLADRPLGLLAYPFLWAGLEVIRTWGQMSFPWGHMGYALGHHLALIQAASAIGIFGISAAVVASNVLLYGAWRLSSSGPIASGAKPGFARMAAAISAAAAATIPAALWIYGNHALSRPDPDAGVMDIGLVQPSIPQTKKWDEHYFQDVMQKTWRTMDGSGDGLDTATHPLRGSDLIVLPETAVPDFLRSRPEIKERLAHTARDNGADIVVGALDFVPDNKPYRAYLFYNSAFLFPARANADRANADTVKTGSGNGATDMATDQAADKAGDGASDGMRQYSKLRLVPFSERLPFDDIFPLINYVNLGEGDFSAGAGYAIWGASVPYAPSICYEVIYPDFVRGARRQGAKLLVNITNDGWFGYSNAPFQHANITRFRAVEVGMPIARGANSGISVFYDYKGRILGKTRLFEQTVLRRKVSLATRDTGYLDHGDAIEMALGLLFGVGLAVSGYLAWKSRSAPTGRGR